MTGLTHRQWELLRFIEQRMQETRVPPSYDEMREALGLKSKSGISKLIDRLIERGAVTMQPNKPRSLRIIGGNPLIGGQTVALSSHVYGKAEAAAKKLGIPVDKFVSSAVEIMADGGFRT